MNSSVSAIDTNSLLTGSAQNQRRTSAVGEAFDDIFSRFQAANPNPPAAITPAASASSASASRTTSTASSGLSSSGSSNTPIERLRESLEASGSPLNSFEATAEDASRLKAILERSGYSQEDAEEIISRVQQEDGSVNLGDMFALLEQYQPTEGPVFLLDVEDKPLLIQVLKGLGVSEAAINEYVQGLPLVDGQLVVGGLPELLSQVSDEATAANPEGFQVDTDILRDLLTRLGLDSQEVQTLVAKAADGSGRTNAEAVLAVLQRAADQQESQVADSLKELAARLKITPVGEETTGDAARIRAQVIQALQGIEARSATQQAQARQAAGSVAPDQTMSQSAEEQLGQFLNGDSDQEHAADSRQSGKDQAVRDAMRLAGDAAARTKPESDAGTERTTNAAQAGKAQAAAQPSQAAQSAGAETASTGLAARSDAISTAQQTSQAASARASLPAYVIRQVGDQMAQMVSRNLSTLRLNLKPPELGGLKLELTVKDGAVRATLVAETNAAKQALDAGAEQLRQMLNQQGLKLERLDVFVQADSHETQAEAQNGQSGQGGSSSGNLAGGDAAGEAEEIDIAAIQAAQHAGRINLFA